MGRWCIASVACWLVASGRWYSERYISWGLSVCRLGSRYILLVREYFKPSCFRFIVISGRVGSWGSLGYVCCS